MPARVVQTPNGYAIQPAFAGAISQNYGNFAQAMAGMGNAYGNAFGAYGAGLGSVANARANEASARYGANAMAEAARQAGAGNIGAAALGAYGSAANGAFAAWGANQNAYNQAAASMHNANQQGLSQYGQSRNQALAGLGNAYGSLGKGQMAANAMGNFNMNFGGAPAGGGGGGFTATGPGGPIASGSYGASPGGGGGGSFTGSFSRQSSPSAGAPEAYAGLNDLQANLMAGDITQGLNYGAAAGRDQLDRQHYSSRGMPSQMLDQTLGGLMRLGQGAYQAGTDGMNQFYANTQMDERPYTGILDSLTRGYGDATQNMRGVQGDIRSGYETANDGVQGMLDDFYDRTMLLSDPGYAAYQRLLKTSLDARERGITQDPHRVALLDDLTATYGPRRRR